MVGIVVVSHSQQAAEGIAAIAREMGDGVAIEAVGGTPDGGIGTTPDPIRQAIEAADDGGVVILVDLGSAVMNTELAVESATADGEVVIADAPLLEGTLNATVAATASSATVDAVREAAEDAWDTRKT